MKYYLILMSPGDNPVLSYRYLGSQFAPEATAGFELRQFHVGEPRRVDDEFLARAQRRHARHAGVGELLSVGVARREEGRERARVAAVVEGVRLLDRVDGVPLGCLVSICSGLFILFRRQKRKIMCFNIKTPSMS